MASERTTSLSRFARFISTSSNIEVVRDGKFSAKGSRSGHIQVTTIESKNPTHCAYFRAWATSNGHVKGAVAVNLLRLVEQINYA